MQFSVRFTRFVAIAVTVASLVTQLASRADAADDAALLRPIEALVVAIERGDTAGIARAYAPDPSIVDEFAPFRWTGSDAAKRWARGFAASNNAGNVTDVGLTHEKPRFVTRSGERAWLVYPAKFTFRVGGKPAWETAAWTFALVRIAGAWRIEASTWAKTGESAT